MKESESEISTLFNEALAAVEQSQNAQAQKLDLNTQLQFSNSAIKAVENYAKITSKTYVQAYKEINKLINIEDDSLPM